MRHYGEAGYAYDQTPPNLPTLHDAVLTRRLPFRLVIRCFIVDTEALDSQDIAKLEAAVVLPVSALDVGTVSR